MVDKQAKRYIVSRGQKRGKKPFKFHQKCFRCGKEGHFARSLSCPAKFKTCNKCNMKGHLAAMCNTKNVDQHKKSYSVKRVYNCGEDNKDEHAFSLSGNMKTEFMLAKIGGIPVEMISRTLEQVLMLLTRDCGKG